MSETQVYVVAAVAVVIVALIVLAFSKGWMGKVFFRYDNTEAGVSAPEKTGPTLDMNKTDVRGGSKVRNRKGLLKMNRTKVDDSTIENG
ncbi:hypothetical protein AB0395_45925 [Streptosporangium sp. NPDC051023]|uniref:hypothetical protein n=1 Tax=Streptosporangium sp. NPDC051023 TaxID=3155410 RepID=UPI00344FC37E